MRQDIEDYRDLNTGKSSNLKDEYRKRAEQHEKERKPEPRRDKSRGRGHEPELAHQFVPYTDKSSAVIGVLQANDSSFVQCSAA